jgi:CspA family cold shock protein
MAVDAVITGTVRLWHAEDGWGVIDAPQTPGGCWTHFSVVAVPGYRALEPGQRVELQYERAEQDAYAFRAVRAWPHGQAPHDPESPSPSDSVYRSTLTVTFDDA